MDHGPRQRTPIPRLRSDHHIFSDEDLAAYLTACDITVVEFRGHLWRNRYAPNPITGFAWTPMRRWEPLPRAAAGYPNHSALAYRAPAQEPVASTFPYTVFGDLASYGEHRMNRHRARHTRQALDRYEYVTLDDPELLLAEGWQVMRDAYRFRDSATPVTRTTFERQMTAIFDGKPPVIWAALSDGRLAAYMISYAIGSEATLEKLYISPDYRDDHLGVGLYWVVVTGWAQTPGIRNVWAGGTMPQRGVDRFKMSMGAVLENVRVHAGMRGPVRMGYRILKPDAYSLKDLHA